LCDLFHGKTSEAEFSYNSRYGPIRWIGIIGDQHLLIRNQDGYSILKIDYKSWKIDVLLEHRHDRDRFGFLLAVVDRFDNRNFLIYYNTGFIRGSSVGDQVILDPHREFDVGYLVCSKLDRNKIIGLSFSYQDLTMLWKYCEIDLINLAKTTTDIFVPRNQIDHSPALEVNFLYLFLI
jgi:hypothetical protein